VPILTLFDPKAVSDSLLPKLFRALSSGFDQLLLRLDKPIEFIVDIGLLTLVDFT
jgi:hypothetical protein